MIKIATHNSGTGECSHNWLHSLFKIFACTQTKTIEEQFKAGCRYFDLRVNKEFIICHGLWKSNKNLLEILSDLEYLACKYSTKVYYSIAVENNFKSIDSFIEKLNAIRQYYSYIECVYIARKKPTWNTLYTFCKVPAIIDYISVPAFKDYLNFNLKNWKRYIPIPKILNRFYKRKYKYNDRYFVMVDFL